jgi:putative transcriptional regulator
MPTGIRAIRQKLGMTRKEFANALNVTQMSISNYENNIRYPAISIGYKILNLAKKNGLNVSLENIYPPTQRILTKQH